MPPNFHRICPNRGGSARACGWRAPASGSAREARGGSPRPYSRSRQRPRGLRGSARCASAGGRGFASRALGEKRERERRERDCSGRGNGKARPFCIAGGSDRRQVGPSGYWAHVSVIRGGVLVGALHLLISSRFYVTLRVPAANDRWGRAVRGPTG